MASESPRRQEFFRLLGLPFVCIPSGADESFDQRLDPKAVAEELAVRKIKKILETRAGDTAPWICGADTLIHLNGKIYGKPRDRVDAERMLLDFQGKTHEVICAIALYNSQKKTYDCRSVASAITFAPVSQGEIDWYLDCGEWQDAAGAYKIQGKASCFITGIHGSYSAVVGLPLREFYAMLRDNGYQYGCREVLAEPKL